MISKCKCDPYYTCKACRLGEGLTYQQIGDELGISHQAAWEIEKRALNKLQKLLKQYNLTIQDLLL